MLSEAAKHHLRALIEELGGAGALGLAELAQRPIPFRMFGLQRSCTNLMGWLAQQNFYLRVAEGGLEWRHLNVENFPLDIDGQQLHVLFCIKNPYAWLSSMQRWCMAPDTTTRKRLGITPALDMSKFLRHSCGGRVGPAAHWSQQNQHWLSVFDKYPKLVHIVKAGSLYGAANQTKALVDLAAAWDLRYRFSEVITESCKMRIDFTPSTSSMDTSVYQERKYLEEFTKEDLKLVNSQLDRDLMSRFEFSVEEA